MQCAGGHGTWIQPTKSDIRVEIKEVEKWGGTTDYPEYKGTVVGLYAPKGTICKPVSGFK